MATYSLKAQQYTGTTGFIHVPSSDMNRVGDVMIGAHFLNKNFTPDGFKFRGNKYHTMSHYLSLTPFSWFELGYTCTFFRTKKQNSDRVGLFSKDRYFSFKIRPLKEGRWVPSIAVGSNDPFNSSLKGISNGYFRNFYVAATKHFVVAGDIWGANVAYRKFIRAKNDKWTGFVGGITYSPRFAHNLRVIGEYTSEDFSIGADCLLWNHLMMQASLQNGKHFSGGLCLRFNIL